MTPSIRRGDLLLVNLDPVLGREIGKTRPAVVVQNDIGNRHSPTLIVVPVTGWSQMKAEFPFCVEIPPEAGLPKRSLANAAQIRTVDRRWVVEVLGHLPGASIEALDRALEISLGLDGRGNVGL